MHLQFPTTIPEMQEFLEMLLTVRKRDTISIEYDKCHKRSLQSTMKLAGEPGSKPRTVQLTIFALLVSLLTVHLSL